MSYYLKEVSARKGQRFELMRTPLRKDGEPDKRTVDRSAGVTVDVEPSGKVRVYSGGVVAYERGFDKRGR